MISKFTGLFTSEAVSPGHPDKLCDLIADSLVDEYLQTKNDRVAIEALAGRGYIIVVGNVRSTANVNVKAVVRRVLRNVGYNSEDLGISAESCAVFDGIDEQSSDIAHGVDEALEIRNSEGFTLKKTGAGDQGHVFGYAVAETSQYMPLAHVLATGLMEKAWSLFKLGVIDWLRPDMKSQVTVRYCNGSPVGVDTVVMSVQHSPEVDNETIRKTLYDLVILPVLHQYHYDGCDKLWANPSGRFVLGGPAADCGTVGRKIVVDSYGGYAPIGGGCFSGKDPTKVDRSGAYMARYIAKNLVATGFAQECLVQISYAIGKAEPVSVFIDTNGTSLLSSENWSEIVRDVFDMTPDGIASTLGLYSEGLNYQDTTNFGHFGRENPNFGWESLDKVEVLKGIIYNKYIGEIK